MVERKDDLAGAVAVYDEVAAMTNETWELLEKYYQRYPSSKATGIDAYEFEKGFIGLPASQDYREYVMRFGGGIIGAEPIYGLRFAAV